MYPKVILIILVSILAGLVLFLGGYLISSNNLHQTTLIGQLGRFENQNSGLSANTRMRLHRLSTVKALGPAISEDGKKVLFFEEETGKIMASDFEGRTGEVVSGKFLNNLTSALWSSNGYEALLAQRLKESLRYSYFNLKTNQTNNLSPQLTDPVWSHHGKKIAYLYFNPTPGEGSISIAHPDGSLFNNILSTRLDQLSLSWPKENLLSFYNRSEETRSLFIFDISTNALTKIFGPAEDLQTLWSPDASKILLSYTSGSTKKISYLNLADLSETAIGLLTTAPKCAWSSNAVYVYCGAKENEEQTEGLYLMDTVSQSFTRTFTSSPLETLAIDRPFLTPAEDFLIFINSADHYLYSIRIQ